MHSVQNAPPIPFSTQHGYFCPYVLLHHEFGAGNPAPPALASVHPSARVTTRIEPSHSRTSTVSSARRHAARLPSKFGWGLALADSARARRARVVEKPASCMVCGRVRKKRLRWGGNSEEVVDRSVGYDRGGGGCCCSSDEARECFFAEDELELCDVWLCVCGMLAVGGGQYLYLCVTLKHMLNVDDSLTVRPVPPTIQVL